MGSLVLAPIVTIPSASILTLADTPVTVIAAPGEGRAIVPVEAYLFLDFNSIAYVGSALRFHQTDASGFNYAGPENVVLQSEADSHRIFLFESSLAGLYAMPLTTNAPLVLVAASNPTTGDSVLKVQVRYRLLRLMT
jgi:hypothetical protein